MSIADGISSGIAEGIASGITSDAAAQSFNPLLVTSATPLLYYDASDESSITSSGSNASQIADKTGNGNHGKSNTTTNQPQTGTTSQNGLNTLYFDNDYLTLRGDLTVDGTSPISGLDSDSYCIYFTGKEYSARTTNAGTISLRSSTAADLYVGKLGTLTRTYTFGTETGSWVNSVTTLVSEDVFHSIIINVGTHGIDLYVDGTKTNMTATQPNSGMWDTFAIGTRAATNVLQQMEMGEIAFYNAALNAADIEDLLTWSARWGI